MHTLPRPTGAARAALVTAACCASHCRLESATTQRPASRAIAEAPRQPGVASSPRLAARRRFGAARGRISGPRTLSVGVSLFSASSACRMSLSEPGVISIQCVALLPALLLRRRHVLIE
jgi:hypothetical protein